MLYFATQFMYVHKHTLVIEKNNFSLNESEKHHGFLGQIFSV